jgi:hypothetical protein
MRGFSQAVAALVQPGADIADADNAIRQSGTASPPPRWVDDADNLRASTSLLAHRDVESKDAVVPRFTHST